MDEGIIVLVVHLSSYSHSPSQVRSCRNQRRTERNQQQQDAVEEAVEFNKESGEDETPDEPVRSTNNQK